MIRGSFSSIHAYQTKPMKKPSLIGTILLAGSLLLQLNTLCFHARGAAGEVDLSFDAGSAGWADFVNAFAVQPDGKLFVGGGSITRVNSDGSRDSSFVVEQDPNQGIGFVTALAVQADGKLLVCHLGGMDRLNADGSQDPSFTAPLITGYDLSPGGPAAVAIYPDGKILIGGGFRVVDGQIRSSLARLHPNGSLDASFVPGTSDNDLSVVSSIVLQPDGKALIAGQSMTTRNDSVARVNPDGSLDQANFFSVRMDDFVTSVALQADGKLIVADYSGAIKRLNQDGSLDPAFNAGADRGVFAMALRADGKILIGGAFNKVSGIDRDRIARLNADGTLDTAFNAGPGPHPSIFAVAVLPNALTIIGGRDLAGTGEINPFDRLIRLHPDGSRDGTFTTEGTGIGGEVYSLLPQPDGKVLISGAFRSINRTRLRGNNARLNADGSFDSTFDPGGPAGNILLQPDGKIIIGGSNIYFSGQNSIARFNADGSADTGFSLGTGADSGIRTVALLGDGRLLVGGGFGSINGTPRNGIARLNSDGSLDTTFTADLFEFGNSIRSIVVQPDGKALIGGEFSSADNTKRYGMVRLNANGSLDSSFTHVAVSNGFPIDVTTIALQQDGRVIIGGYFHFVHGTARDGIARLNANGTLDTAFNPDPETVFGAGPIALQVDGKALVGAGASGASGGIVRLNLDGSLDDTFQAPVVGNVPSIAVQSDGNILVAGGVTTVNGVRGVARLFSDSVILPSLSIARSGAFAILSWPSTAAPFRLHETTDLSLPDSWSPVAEAAVINGDQVNVTVPTTAPRRFFRLQPGSGGSFPKVYGNGLTITHFQESPLLSEWNFPNGREGRGEEGSYSPFRRKAPDGGSGQPCRWVSPR